MLKQKILLTTLLTGLLIAPAAADLEFRDPDPVQFYTDLNLNQYNITGLPTPQTDSSPLTKGFADENYLNRDSDTLQGRLNANGNNITGLPEPQAGSDAVPKSYVDSNTGSLQDLSQVLSQGNSANQSINMSGNTITNLPNPTTSTEPAPRGYILNNFLRENGDTVNGTLDFLGSNYITAVDQIRTGGQNIQIRDTLNGQDIVRFKQGGNVEVPNGNLNMNNKNVTDPNCIGDQC